ncbi:MAG: hypothetical protein NZM25_05020 [Leptospiraceae bacterium]|nr:hypothetical protein [Leptospiraceae bacterium]MDW8305629.1 hypothetical protein [Leptospiraceae bacterium]
MAKFFFFAIAPFFSITAATVVLDPGHGGRYLYPYRLYGDKFDKASGGYLDRYREGARERGIYESEWMYALAQRIKSYLDKTLLPKGHSFFKSLLARYGKAPSKIKPVRSFLSRQPSYYVNYYKRREDLNEDFRLFDYENWRTGEKKLGTISRINSYCPELVVTLHLTETKVSPKGGLASVITPGYTTFELARQYIMAPENERSSFAQAFEKTPYANWFISEGGYNAWQSFLKDAWIYFTGYAPEKNGLHPKSWRGLRHNLISWSYAEDSEGIERPLWQIEGRFWERERSLAEKWRREGGEEGYGGDNFFASQQLLRFIRLGLFLNKVDSARSLPEIFPPYISTWAVPTFVNAVSAYLEVAHLGSKRDFQRISRHLEIYAQSISVGIYYLFYPFPLHQIKIQDRPLPKGVDFDKYREYPGGNYFTAVGPCWGMNHGP